MEPEPVEDCVQNTLSALYPPFAATAPTLLGQVFEVVERTYREDALHYTIEFLIPAKHILARIQQEACAQYSGFVFCHEGWPLCLHEKVVVQLSSLPWQQLCPGDFYLQVAPYLSHAPRLVLKCLSPDGHSVQELPVLPDAYPFLFTAEWLNGINKDRRAGRLERCLLAAEERVLRLPWTELICPQFVHQGSFMVGRRCLPGPSPEVLGARSPGDGRHSGGESQEAEAGGLEGEYVQLLEISPPRHDAPQTPVSPSSQSRTLPARKGQGKGRNRRHRAWLHHKSSREETLPRNRPRRTWEGGRPGADPGQAGLLRGWDLQRPYGETGGPRVSQGDGQDRGGPAHKVAAQSRGKGGRLPGERQWGGDTGEKAGDPSLGDEQCGGDPPEGQREGDLSLREEQHAEDLGEGQHVEDPSFKVEQRGGDPEEKQQDGVPEERQKGGDCSLREEQQSRDPGTPAISPQPSTVAEVQGLSEGGGQAAWPAAWPSPGQQAQSQGLSRQSSPQHEASSADLRSARAEPPGARTSPQQGAIGDSAAGLPHRAAKGNRRRRKWGGRGCPTNVDWKEPGSPGTGVGDAPAGTKEGGIPAGTRLPVVLTPGEGDIPPNTKKEGSSSGTRLPITSTPGEGGIPPTTKEGGVPPSSTEGGSPSGTGLPVAPTPGEGGIPPSSTERDSPSGTGPPVAPTPGEGGIPPSSTERDSPSGTGPPVAPTPGEGGIPPSSTERDSPSGTGLPVVPTPGEGGVPPSSTEPDSPSVTRLPVAPTSGEGAIPPSQEEETCADCPGQGALTAALAEAAVPTGAEEEAAPRSLERTEAIGAGTAPFVKSALPLTGGAGTSCPVESLPPTSAPVGQDVDWELLGSGIFQLTGGVDRMGRALLTVTPQPPGEPAPAQGELSQALRYLHSLLRKEQQELGLTVLLDLRQGGALSPHPPALLPALQELQEVSPALVSRLLVLAPLEGHEELPLIQEALVLSPSDLPQFVDPEQLQPTLGGTLQHSQTQWVETCQALERLCGLCQGVIQSVQVASAKLEASELAESDEALSVRISGHKDAMQKLLSDPRLLELQSSGGSLLAQLSSSGTCSGQATRAASLYQEVDDAIHRLVQLSNRCLGQLEQERSRRQMTQVVGWLADHGEQALAGFTPMGVGDSLLTVEETLAKFEAFHTLAKEWLARGHEALRLAGDGVLAPEGQQLESFARRLESCAHTMHNALRLHRFLQQAQDWALEGVRRLSAIEDGAGPEVVLGSLGRYCQQHGEISDSAFQEMRGLAVQNPWALRELGRCRARCQELGRLLQRRLEVALQTGPPPRRRADSTSISSSPQRTTRGLDTSLGSSRSMSCLLPPPGSLSPGLCEVPSCHSLVSPRDPMENSDEERSPPPTSTPTAAFFQAPTLPLGTLPPCQPPPRGPPSTQRALSEPGPSPPRPSVLIRGLEVSSQEVVDRTCSPREHVMLVRSSAQRAEAPWGGTPSTERKRRLGAQQRLVAELIASEQEYLGCLAESLPLESGCQEVPPELRRECSALEGTRDRLLGFHRAYFLKELQGCASHPLRAGGCFLRYADQFSLYALYVKNWQKLQAALASQQAANKMAHSSLEGPWEDTALASALQRPLEQLEHYGHFLEELLQETDPEQATEREALRAAQQLLESQVQHGRNLLAMEQIRGCELELKAQGQLLHRDEFTVLRGRRKCHRHVFLFEQLLLFSKRKGTEGGLDVYVYKQAYKTADMGLTENIGESGLRFELWFRRRKLREAYTLQASSPEVKHKWTSAVAQLLWRQATLSKELRTQEMVSMGIGDKPFVSIQSPSQALLSSLLTGRAARTRASVAVSSFSPWAGAPCSPPAATSSPRPSPAPLGLICDASAVSPASGRSPGACSLPGHLEEEEWELDVKRIPRASETAAGSGAAPALGEPSPRWAESPGGSAPVQRRPSWVWSLHRKLFASRGCMRQDRSPGAARNRTV
ncbi:rho guanine nucleotide exchange factor 40 isoform X2 [Chelonia mydas]|uniref:rho guanine nucleotide exchange factor 40 isoform X2 n=1 Tax=Chelonia mydas TaxID=8469 RepID=UPI0018A20341|nr:rho guanine nucleotide exchange factor 40 isoform X2 [Chelonia mydas]